MNDNLPKRKPNRLENFDYGAGYSYFITICTKDRAQILSSITTVGAAIGRPQDVALTQNGQIVDEAINNISQIYPTVSVDYYVIMPNHVHLLLTIHETAENGRPMAAPTLARVINKLKGFATKKSGNPLWQKLYYDHIIRNKKDYEEISKYIYENPINWETDEFYN